MTLDPLFVTPVVVGDNALDGGLAVVEHQVLVGVGLIGGVGVVRAVLADDEREELAAVVVTSLGRELQSEGVARILEQLVINLGVLAIAAQ